MINIDKEEKREQTAEGRLYHPHQEPHRAACDEPVEQEEKEEFVELMTRGQFVQKGGSFYITYKETQTTGYEGCTTTLKIAADGSRVAMLRFGKGGGAGTQLLIERERRNLCHYETRLGSMTLGVTADEIDCNLTEKGGTAVFSYLLDADSAGLVSRKRGNDRKM